MLKEAHERAREYVTNPLRCYSCSDPECRMMSFVMDCYQYNLRKLEETCVTPDAKDSYLNRVAEAVKKHTQEFFMYMAKELLKGLSKIHRSDESVFKILQRDIK